MVDPTPLSPLLRDLCAKVAPIEARLAILDAEIATREQERDGLRSTLAGICRALDPEQVTLPLPGLGTEATPLREPSRMAELLLRRAVALAAEGEVGMPRLVIARDAVSRGELKCAHALAAGVRPLLVEESCTKAAKVYRLTADGETVARALPAKGGEGA